MKTEHIPSFFKAISDATRLAVLQVLGTGAYGVLELSDLLDVKQSGMSHHLKVLAKAGWVDSRREGNSIYYRRSLGDALGVQQRIFRELDSNPLPKSVRIQQQQIREERLNAARQFFVEHTEEFELHQERIVLFEHYGPEALQLLDSLDRPRQQRVLEVGPGKGEFLKALSQRFDQVVGIDISPVMLEQAGEQVKDAANVTLLEGSTESLLTQGAQFDVIIYNMVLHHVPMPESEIAQCAKLLNPNGLLIITDLCHHDQEWAREQCGDQWLGFEPEELHQWAKRHGFDHDQTRFLALRNGFQVQTQVYRNA
ncbi:metalloregulator ArsR/SmtB family transcription factor [Reinekea sp. G2M2-21]|uniref:metalloregulator ArsR/SmtB family transcription factor n=1 Tax=Reinekea sp. G2M2-21 TaxID=2788942 RepID=UPI0018A8E3B9|nr:metalloregulator ArsR/SmtB family transcription factor [Reinekea sp. G2M2-21]